MMPEGSNMNPHPIDDQTPKRNAHQAMLIKATLYRIAAFQKGESREQANSEHAALRTELVGKFLPLILAAVEVWADPARQRSPDGYIVQEWWEIERLVQYHGGLTPEGTALSLELRKEASKQLGPEGYRKWEREYEDNKAATHQLWTEADKAKIISSAKSTAPSTSGLSMAPTSCGTEETINSSGGSSGKGKEVCGDGFTNMVSSANETPTSGPSEVRSLDATTTENLGGTKEQTPSERTSGSESFSSDLSFVPRMNEALEEHKRWLARLKEQKPERDM